MKVHIRITQRKRLRCVVYYIRKLIKKDVYQYITISPSLLLSSSIALRINASYILYYYIIIC